MSTPFLPATTAIEALAATASQMLPPSVAQSNASGGTVTFGELVHNGLQQINQELLVGQVDLQQVALGNTQNLHHVMIRLEETRQHFQLLMQLRTRLLDAYQEMMRMPV